MGVPLGGFDGFCAEWSILTILGGSGTGSGGSGWAPPGVTTLRSSPPGETTAPVGGPLSGLYRNLYGLLSNGLLFKLNRLGSVL